MSLAFFCALLAAVLFGASTPLAKPLLTHMGPWQLSAFLYLGSALAMALIRILRAMTNATTPETRSFTRSS